MISLLKHQPTVNLLLSLGAAQRQSGEFVLPKDMWLEQRESIQSSLDGVGYKLWPLLRVTFSCEQCGKKMERRASEMEKHLDRRNFCSLTCATIAKNEAKGFSRRTCKECGMQLPSKATYFSLFCGDVCRRKA